MIQNFVFGSCQSSLFPNPVRASGSFKFSVESTGQVEISVLDMQGRLVDILFSEIRTPGIYHHDIFVDDFRKGIYFYRFRAGNYVEVGKIVIMD